jgi:hypothetical protein
MKLLKRKRSSPLYGDLREKGRPPDAPYRVF